VLTLSRCRRRSIFLIGLTLLWVTMVHGDDDGGGGATEKCDDFDSCATELHNTLILSDEQELVVPSLLQLQLLLLLFPSKSMPFLRNCLFLLHMKFMG